MKKKLQGLRGKNTKKHPFPFLHTQKKKLPSKTGAMVEPNNVLDTCPESYDTKMAAFIADILCDAKIRRILDHFSVFDILAKWGIKNTRMVWIKLYKINLTYTMHKFDGQGQKDTPCIAKADIGIFVQRCLGNRQIKKYFGLGDEKMVDGGRKLVREEFVRDHVAKVHNGDTEVIIDTVGRIDVLTEKSVIEVKKAKAWMSALGQLIAYGHFYPQKQKVLYLYGPLDVDLERVINKVCEKNNVRAVFDKDRWTSVHPEKNPLDDDESI